MTEVKEEEEEEEGSRRRPLLRRLRTRLHCWAKASRMRRFSAADRKTRVSVGDQFGVFQHRFHGCDNKW